MKLDGKDTRRGRGSVPTSRVCGMLPSRDGHGVGGWRLSCSFRAAFLYYRTSTRLPLHFQCSSSGATMLAVVQFVGAGLAEEALFKFAGVGKVEASQPPPSALMSWTADTMRRASN